MCQSGGNNSLALSFRFGDGLEIVFFGDRDHRRAKLDKCVQSNTVTFRMRAASWRFVGYRAAIQVGNVRIGTDKS